MALIYWFCSDEQFQPETILEQARVIEQSGFDGLMLSDHFHPWVDDVGASGFAYSIFGAIAAVTSKVKIMSAVTAPLFRFHPAVIAQAAATIDRLSGGRFELGIGTGENINEGPLGFMLPAYAERQARLNEAFEIISRLLAGEKLDFTGEFYQTKAAKLYSPPVHKIPVFLAAGGPKTAAAVANGYDGLMVSVKNPEETLTKVIEPAKQAVSALGGNQLVNSMKIAAVSWSIYAKTDEEAWQAAKSQRGLRAPGRDEAIDPLQLQQAADQLPREDIISRYNRVASVDDYRQLYGPLISELHADIVGIQTTSINQIDTIKLLGRELLHALRSL